jgi:hypothetical protein
MRREHVAALTMLAWSGSARASDEDVAIDRASTDLKCSKNEYVFVACGKRRVYECTAGNCEDVTNRKVPRKNATCAALVMTNVFVASGCACLAVASHGSTGFVPIAPTATRDACVDE